MSEFLAVHTTRTTAEAELVRGALENEGIRAWVEPSSMPAYGFIGDDLARVMVRAEDHERAKAIVRTWARQRA